MLTRTRAFVIEQEYLIALDIQQVLEEAGAEEVEIYRSVADASAHWARVSSAAMAVVDGNLGAKTIVDFAARLADAGVAVVVTSADRGLSTLFPHARFVAKPFDTGELLAALKEAARLN